MFFVLSKVLWYVLAPSSWLVITPVLVLLLMLWQRHKSATVLLSLYSLIMVAITFLPVHFWLLSPLEQRFPRLNNADLPTEMTGIIVLGGSMEENMTEYYQQSSLNAAAERMTATTELALRYPDAKIVLSGGSGLLVGEGSISEAEVARDFLIARGIALDRLLLEDKSRNTLENVRYSQALVQPQADDSWLLVTSAYHMPRSVGIFRQHGWQVMPYPVDYYSAPADIIDMNHSLLERLKAIETACREYIGLVVYRFLGYMESFLPAP